MDFLELGDTIDYPDYNSIVYLLRKFKRLTAGLVLGGSTIVSDYGSFSVGAGLTSVGGNFIVESAVLITSSDVLRNCFYSFVFNVIDVNLSGTVNKRQVKVTGETGDNGELSVVLPTDLIDSDEVLLPDFELDIVFDPHEQYVPISDLNVTLSSSKTYIVKDETVTLSATVKDGEGNAMVGISVGFSVNGEVTTETTDSSGVASLTYTGSGDVGKVTVTALGESLVFYDGGIVAEYNKSYIIVGVVDRLYCNGNVVINWGDGTTSTINKRTISVYHYYRDNQSSHTITFIGDITGLGRKYFSYCDGLTAISIPEGVTSIGQSCFNECTDLTSVVIPSTVNSIGQGCFIGCSALIDYQLYWTIPPNIWNNNDMPDNSGTVFTIPDGASEEYIAKQYPSGKLDERTDKTPTTLTCVGSSASINVGSSVTFSGVLKDSSDNKISNASVKLYNGSTLVDTLTTDSNGAYSKTVSGLSAGSYTFQAKYEGDSTYKKSNSSTVSLTVTKLSTTTSLSATSASIVIGASPSLTGTLKDSNNTGVTGASVKIYSGDTLLDTVTTTTGGAFSYTGSATSSTGSLTFKAVYDGDSTYSNSESSSVTITVTDKIVTTVSLSATRPIYVGDAPSLTGSLVDSSDNPIASASVKIYKGETLLGTVTTDSNGEFTESDTATTSTGTLSYKAVYEGDTTYASDESDTVTVTVTKIPTVITLSANYSSVNVGDHVSIEGTLKDVNNNPLSWVRVSIFLDNQLVEEALTSNGYFAYDYTPTTSGQVHFKASYAGDSTYDSVTSNDVVVNVNKVNTGLDIDVPLNLVYSDAFNITGTLTDESLLSVGIDNATVKLKVGNTVVDTGTTNNNGVVQFTQTPVSMGNHTFQLVYEGTAKYNAVDSQTVSRTIGKETSVITVTSPTNNSSWYSDGAVTVTGTLLTDDGEAMASKSIVISESGTTLTTLTTDSNGAFSGSLTGLSIGSHSLKFEFITDDYYAATNVTRSVTIASPTLSVTGTKSVLSYADSESSVITATYTGASVSGKSVVFKNGSTVLDTVTTDSNGQASYTYTSSGAGDVTITVECMNLQETFVVEDCHLYDTTEHSQNQDASFPTLYNNFTFPNTGDYEVSLDVKITANAKRFEIIDSTNLDGYAYAGIGANGNGYIRTFEGVVASSTEYDSSHTYGTFTKNSYVPLKIVKQNNTVDYYYNGNKFTSHSPDWITQNINLTLRLKNWYGGGYIYAKNIKVKAL